MKLSLICVLIFFGLNLQIQAQTLNLMTFNIRYNTVNDGINQWENRKHYVSGILNFHDVDICGMQEALIGQIHDVQKDLPKYNYLGLGRDDGKNAGEFSPILYLKDKFEVLESETFWLSQTPKLPSKGWDASFNRVVTWAKFKVKNTHQEFFVFNTHFDHMGVIARRESAKLLIQEVKRIAKESPAVIMGDFNSNLQDEPYLVINQAFQNTKAISKSGHFGPNSTFNGFESKEIPDKEIDHIFINNPKIRILKHGTLSQTWGGLFASDHHPVFINIAF